MNVLRDGGSYSYAADATSQDCFTGSRGHNTIQFDDHEQMLWLGRFLRGPWLKTKTLKPVHYEADRASVSASYSDAWGVTHARSLTLEPKCLTVTDRLDGFRYRAVLRWRLRPGAWAMEGGVVTDQHHRLEISADVPIVRHAIIDGWESRYYLHKTTIPILEVEVREPGTITTKYRWQR